MDVGTDARPFWLKAALAFTASALLGFCALPILTLRNAPQGAHAQPRQDPYAALKRTFARPTFVPQPADNPPSAERIALGQRLFEDKALSSTGTIACASCH
ncbi:MAG: hypothetical protein K2X43_04370, partial [Hyphomonadaceae bacterium]|nr:hypothetical protein [Hyphomonadaceae bacterium]